MADQMVCGHRNGRELAICGRDVRRVFIGPMELWGHETRLPDGQHHYVIPVPATGRAKPSGRTPTPVMQRFDARVDRSGGPEACWPWTGRPTGSGYGKIRTGPRTEVIASRLALETHLGRLLAPGMLALHTCDNRLCCNPGHLYEGSDADNARDRETRGRLAHPQLRTCKRGHSMADAITRPGRSGRLIERMCRTCRLERQRRYSVGPPSGRSLPAT